MSGGGYGAVPSGGVPGGGVPGGGALSGGGDAGDGAPAPVPWSRIRDSAYWLQEVVKRGEPALRPDVGHIVLARTAGMAEREPGGPLWPDVDHVVMGRWLNAVVLVSAILFPHYSVQCYLNSVICTMLFGTL
jgi:hypothetical protein